MPSLIVDTVMSSLMTRFRRSGQGIQGSMGSSRQGDGHILIGQVCCVAIHFILLSLFWMLLGFFTIGFRLFVCCVRIAFAPSMIGHRVNRTLCIVRDTSGAFLHLLRLLRVQLSFCLELTFIIFLFFENSRDGTVTLVGGMSSAHLPLLSFISLLATFGSFLLHSKEPKQLGLGCIAHGTTGVLVLLLPLGRHTVKESLMQLILSERKIVAQQPVYLAVKLL
jgi:hypothetical protein